MWRVISGRDDRNLESLKKPSYHGGAESTEFSLDFSVFSVPPWLTHSSMTSPVA
jgi:hypothetical protein